VGEIDPASSDQVHVDDGVVDRRRHVLVSKDGVELRVEVWSEDLLEEVHELDGEGRVVRSLYRTPLDDDAVEVRYDRDDEGEATRVTRLDRTGKPRLHP
jgi:hypothetical protein